MKLNAIKNAVKVLKPGKKIQEAATPAEPKKSAVPALVLVVWHLPLKNTQILTAYKEGDDPTNPHTLVVVNVQANFNFMPGMKLTRVTANDKGGYDFVGAPPRWKRRI